MTKYRVWGKGIEEEDDAIEIVARNAENAAIKWGDTKGELEHLGYHYYAAVVYVLDENGKCDEYTIYSYDGFDLYAIANEEE